jgi:hypothetical protein
VFLRFSYNFLNKRLIISLNNINELIVVTEPGTGFTEVGTEFVNIILQEFLS